MTEVSRKAGELPFDELVLPEEWRGRAADIQTYMELYRRSVEDLEGFWGRVAGELEWFRRWDRVLDDSRAPYYRWFVGGRLNISHLALDVHVRGWRRNKLALIWEGEPVGESGAPREVRRYTYFDLYREVNRAAYVLRHRFGVGKGDRITLYMPMIPEAVVFEHAAWRVGAIVSPVFSGFSAEALAARVGDLGSRLVVTADGFWRRGRVVRLKEIVDRALGGSSSVEHVLVFPRLGLGDTPMVGGRDVLWGEAMGEVPLNARVKPESVESEHPYIVLYTSGTTGKPKGVVLDTGGFTVHAYAATKWLFDFDERDVYWNTADLGWGTSQYYMMLGGFLHGLTNIMYEGAPDYPGPDRWWSIVERYGVTKMYTSPTAVRTLMRYGDEWVKRHDTSTLKVIQTVGEPMNPEAWRWLFKVVGGGKLVSSSTLGWTEGGVATGVTPGYIMVPMKPGSNDLPLPGFRVEVVDEEGKPTPPGVRGYVVLKPWPGMLVDIWGDPARYMEYWSRFPGWFYPGDYALRDKDGYIWALGRADETLKVAGHRLGTFELESAFVKHPAVAEAGVIGVPDPVKGEVPVAFVVLREGVEPSVDMREELRRHVRETIGPVAEPAHIFFVTRLPKTRSGKIMRRLLKNVALGKPLGDTTTLEDGAAVEEAKAAYEQLKKEIA